MPVRLTFRRFLKSYWHFWYSLHVRKKRSILPQGRPRGNDQLPLQIQSKD